MVVDDQNQASIVSQATMEARELIQKP